MCCRASPGAVFQIRSDLIGSEIDKRERSVLPGGLSRLAWIYLALKKKDGMFVLKRWPLRGISPYSLNIFIIKLRKKSNISQVKK